MEKLIDLNNSIFEICNKYPEIIDIMKTLGFVSITNPAMINSVGRFMTIPKGAEMKGIGLDLIKEKFMKNGYTLTGY